MINDDDKWGVTTRQTGGSRVDLGLSLVTFYFMLFLLMHLLWLVNYLYKLSKGVIAFFSVQDSVTSPL